VADTSAKPIIELAPASNRGSITNVAPVGDGTVQATYTSTSTTCTDYNYCGWFPHAGQVPASQSCPPTLPSDITYVGNLQDGRGTAEATVRDTAYR
jgi:hypothetical protein